MTSARAAYSVSRITSIAGVEGSERYDGDGGADDAGEGDIGVGDSSDGDGGESDRLDFLGRSFGGTGGGISMFFRRRGDLASRTGRGRSRSGTGGGTEIEYSYEGVAGECGGETGGDVGGAAS